MKFCLLRRNVGSIISGWVLFTSIFSHPSVAFGMNYDEIIKREKQTFEKASYTHGLESGVAALLVGLYGYYYDDRGLALRVAYAATQTIGVLLIGDAIYDKSRPSPILVTDRNLRLLENGEGTVENFREELAIVYTQDKLAKNKKLAYSSAILSALYLINAQNEDSENRTLRNVYYFLALNTALVSVANFYEIYFDRDVRISVAPYPQDHGKTGFLAMVTLSIRR